MCGIIDFTRGAKLTLSISTINTVKADYFHQAFIQQSSFSNIRFLNKDWVYEMFYFMTNDHEIVLNAGEDLERCCKLRSRFMVEWWWDSEVKTLGNFGLFTSEGEIKSFKQKEPSKLIYFKCRFNTNLFLYALK